MSRTDLFLLGWCVLFVVSFVRIRIGIWARDAWPDTNPWALSTGLAVLSATIGVVWEMAR
jgi:hypothetical protein